MFVSVTHLIRDHAGASEAPFTGRNISEIVQTYADRENAIRDLAYLSSVPQPLSVLGFRLGDARLEI